MRLSVQSQFSFQTSEPTNAMLQFEVAAMEGQDILSSDTHISPGLELTRAPAQDEIGDRILMLVEGEVHVTYSASVDITRSAVDLDRLEAPELQSLPGNVVPYLFDTRYCLTEKFASFANTEFEGSEGGARIAAIHEWIAEHFTYAPGTSNPDTTALDSFVERRGVCRDYAHVMISLARASSIPARYVACYGPDIQPPDFHAVAQVYLSDPATGIAGWHLVDPTGMSRPEATAIIGVGRDAADVSFLTTFGFSEFGGSSITVALDE